MTRSASLREETPHDHPDITELLRAAFHRSEEADLVKALRKAGDLVFGGVAAIIGYVALSKMRALFPALGLGPVAVAATDRQKGVASTLLHWSLAHVQKDQWRAIFVLGEGAFYGRSDSDPSLQSALARHMRDRVFRPWRSTARFQPRRDR
ncbi:GNAT family N-acetyltransferase [Methylocystis rosea]|uniref:GNAT family N-acetyltransferase n=1 Tax=Methylocystis rosea TaxID=173366 RepID=A0ABX6EKR0_9HYPH|nr:GNAT family N-acetyltransferase [Methylocystis rosea]QGM95080.1 GNAT family N-acetyltransferase [Methylocystis rosea]